MSWCRRQISHPLLNTSILAWARPPNDPCFPDVLRASAGATAALYERPTVLQDVRESFSA
jgi:hypothetical protein